MKRVALLCLMLVISISSCDSPQSFKQNLYGIYYWQDPKTDICYSSYELPYWNDFSYTYVPCTPKVLELIKDEGDIGEFLYNNGDY